MKKLVVLIISVVFVIAAAMLPFKIAMLVVFGSCMVAGFFTLLYAGARNWNRWGQRDQEAALRRMEELGYFDSNLYF